MSLVHAYMLKITPIGQLVNFGNDFTIAEYEGVHKFSTSSIAPNNEIDHLS